MSVEQTQTDIEHSDDRPYDIKVTVKSKRGTGTRDQDTVEIEGYFDDIDELDDKQESLNLTLKRQMRKARKNDPNFDRE